MMKRRNRHWYSQNFDEGTALVAAVWLSLILALLSIAVISLTRTTTIQTRINTKLEKAYSLAEGGLAIAAYHIADARDPWRPRLEPYSTQIGEQDITVYVDSPQSKIDLNGANAALLAGLFRELGFDTDRADILAARIADYRDADDLVRLNGAEERAYLEAGLRGEPKNAAFEAINEVSRVLGMDTLIYECIKPYLTLYAPSGQIDPVVARGVVRRTAGYGDNPPITLPSVRRSSLAGQVFEVRVQVPISDYAAAELAAIIRFTGNPADPVWRHSLERRTVSLRTEEADNDIPKSCPVYATNSDESVK